MSAELKLLKVFSLKCEMEVVTGLRIGGANARIEIGNVDNIVIKHPISGKPYVPGSSIKGKMRTLMQYSTGRVLDGGVWTIENCKDKSIDYKVDPILRIFGTSGKKESDWLYGPARLIVRDAVLKDEEIEQEKMKNGEKNVISKQPMDYLEIKTEVAIDRLTGTAARSGPRPMERVTSGTIFNVKMIYRVYEVKENGKIIGNDEQLFFEYIPKLFHLLELDYLGGCGSRGYGKVQFGSYKLKDIPYGKNEAEVEEMYFDTTPKFIAEMNKKFIK